MAGVTGAGVAAVAHSAAAEGVPRAGRGRFADAEVMETYSVEVAPGGEAEVDVDVGVGEESPVDRVDVLFCFDLTGSMSGEINTVKDKAVEIMEDIDDSEYDTAFGFTGFRDYPSSYDAYGYNNSYGDPDDTPWEVYQEISTDFETVEATINGDGSDEEVDAVGGSDTPESVTRALYEVENDEEIGWREGSLRIVVMFGDAQPHDEDFHEEADEYGEYSTWSTGMDPGRDEEMFTEDDLDFQTTVENMSTPVITVDSGSNWGSYDAHWRYIAEETGGEYKKLENAEEIPSAVVDLVTNESGAVTLSLEPESGYGGWLTFSPEEHEDVEAGGSETFAVTLHPPEDADLGTKTIDLYALADGSEIGTHRIDATIYGETDADVPVREITGGGPSLHQRTPAYGWYEKSLARGYWTSEGRRKLERFREGLPSVLEEVVAELPEDSAAEIVGTDSYLAAIESVEGIDTLSGTLEAWGMGHIEDDARDVIPAERRTADGPSATVRGIRELLADEKTDEAVDRIEKLLDYLRAWYGAVEAVEVRDGYERVGETTLETLELPTEAGESASASFTAQSDDGAIRWWIDEDGYLTLGGEYEVTVDAPSGTVTDTASARGTSIEIGPDRELSDVESGTALDVTITVADAPFSSVPLHSIDLEANVEYGYDYETVESTADDGRSLADLDAEMRETNRVNALRHLASAIDFFEGEKELLSPTESAAVKVESPVNLHVEADDEHLGAVYDDEGIVSAIETTLDVDHAYTGPDAEPEGFTLFGAEGDFDASVKGVDDGTYNLEIFSGEVTESGFVTETVERIEDVPTSPNSEERFSLSIDRSGGGMEIQADTEEIQRAKDAAESGFLGLATNEILLGGGALAAILYLFREKIAAAISER